MPAADGPAVTVITATYNWPDALREAIKTVLSQSFSDFEYLIVGDCCTDETESVVAEFNDPRIRWHNLPENTGNQSGVNKVAMKMAQADLIAYLNHDDLWYPHHLQSLYDLITAQNHDIVSSLALGIKPPGINYREIIGLPTVKPSNGFVRLYPMTSTVMHAKSAAIQAGGWVDWRESNPIPTVDFFRRIRRLRNRHGVVQDITTLKFNSGERKDCYVNKSADEQKHYANIITNDPQFRYREVMKALAFNNMAIKSPSIVSPPRPEHAPPGWMIEQWRLIRGLEPMLDTDVRPEVASIQETEQSIVCIQSDDLTWVNIHTDAQIAETLQMKTVKPSIFSRLKNKVNCVMQCLRA